MMKEMSNQFKRDLESQNNMIEELKQMLLNQ